MSLPGGLCSPHLPPPAAVRVARLNPRPESGCDAMAFRRSSLKTVTVRDSGDAGGPCKATGAGQRLPPSVLHPAVGVFSLSTRGREVSVAWERGRASPPPPFLRASACWHPRLPGGVLPGFYDSSRGGQGARRACTPGVIAVSSPVLGP